jgi:hypothetical protein
VLENGKIDGEDREGVIAEIHGVNDARSGGGGGSAPSGGSDRGERGSGSSIVGAMWQKVESHVEEGRLGIDKDCDFRCLGTAANVGGCSAEYGFGGAWRVDKVKKHEGLKGFAQCFAGARGTVEDKVHFLREDSIEEEKRLDLDRRSGDLGDEVIGVG